MSTETGVRLSAARAADRVTQGTAIEQARAVAEVAAAVQVAQQNPRDTNRALEQMRQSCRQPTLAERAFYSLPRAGGRIEGETVHLARELARCWGNVDHGVRELRRDDTAGESEMQAWAWDQEQNVRASRSFIVPHARMATDRATGLKRREVLGDLGDIANNNNSVAARAVRETIFQVLPPWFKVEAAGICVATLQDGGGKTREQQTADAVSHFRDTWNVTVDQLERRLDRKHERWTPQDIALLRVISGELDRGEKRVEDEFPQRRITAAEITGQQTSSGGPAQSEPNGGEPALAAGGNQGEPPAGRDGAQQSDAPGVTRAQQTKLHTQFNALGIGTDQRADKLRIVAAIVGRPVDSSSDLTKSEATRLIDRLEAILELPNATEFLWAEVHDIENGGGS